MNKITSIPAPLLSLIIEHAERDYPKECCGFILGSVDPPPKLGRVRPCRNVQDDYHERDPENFKRSAASAYFMDPKEILELHKEIRQSKETIGVIYHSHINAKARFSEDDKTMALAGDKGPAYPGVDYLVLSVIAGKVREGVLFRWNPETRDFLPVE